MVGIGLCEARQHIATGARRECVNYCMDALLGVCELLLTGGKTAGADQMVNERCTGVRIN